MKKPILILFSLVGLIVVLTIVRSVVSNQLSTTGVDLNKVSQEIAILERENSLLEERILHTSSYLTILEQAEKRGYTTVSSQIVLTSPLPLAYKQ